MYIPHYMNEKTVTVIINGNAQTITSSHPNFLKVKTLLIEGKHEQVESLISIKTAILNMGGGDIQILGDQVLYQGREVERFMSQKLLSMLTQGHKNIEAFKKFVARMMSNTSARAIEEFPKFMDYKELPIDENGFVIAYRGVQSDYYSKTGNTSTRVISGKVNSQGQIYNGVGEVIRVERADVDDNCNRTCSFGVHCGSAAYAQSWGNGGRVVIVRFDPTDVVSVPTDCDGQKIRVCAYEVIGEFKQEIKEAVYEVKKDTSKPIKESKPQNSYLNAFQWLIKNHGLNYRDSDVIYSLMKDQGYDDKVIIDGLIHDLMLAAKIKGYCERQGYEFKNIPSSVYSVTFKKIQSAMKSYKIKYADIKRVMGRFGKIV